MIHTANRRAIDDTHHGTIREDGSLIAGFLIGLSLVVATFAVTDAVSGAWQDVLLFGAPAVLALGIAVYALLTAEPRRRPATSAAHNGIPRGSAR